jgi:hypothetical protein
VAGCLPQSFCLVEGAGVLAVPLVGTMTWVVSGDGGADYTGMVGGGRGSCRVVCRRPRRFIRIPRIPKPKEV